MKINCKIASVFFTLQVFAYVGQSFSQDSTISAHFGDSIIQSKMFSDLIVFTFDEWDQYNFSKVNTNLIWDSIQEDSIYIEYGQSIVLSQGLKLKKIETKNYLDSSIIENSTFGFYPLEYNYSFVNKEFNFTWSTANPFPITIIYYFQKESFDIWQTINFSTKSHALSEFIEIIGPNDMVFQIPIWKVDLGKSLQLIQIDSSSIQTRFIKDSVEENVFFDNDVKIQETYVLKKENTRQKLMYKNKGKKEVDFKKVRPLYFTTVTEDSLQIKIIDATFSFSGGKHVNEGIYLKDSSLIKSCYWVNYDVSEIQFSNGLWTVSAPNIKKKTSASYFTYDDIGRIMKIERIDLEFKKREIKYFQYADPNVPGANFEILPILSYF